MFVGEMDERHNFRVSGETLPLNRRDIEQMGEIASLIPTFLNGLGKLEQLALIDAKKMRTDRIYRQIRSLLDLGGPYNEILNSPSRNPDQKSIVEDLDAEKLALETEIASKHPICRVDLIKNPNGQLFIAEIEVDKFHGLGYTTFCRILSPNPIGPGLVSYVAEMTKSKTTALILSDQERFYKPEANFFARAVNNNGGKLVILPQNKIILELDYGKTLQIEQLLGIPELSGETKARQIVKMKLIESGIPVLSIFSPNLSEKTTMALIHSTDVAMNEILKTVFDPTTLKRLRQYIPYTESMSGTASLHRQEIAEEIGHSPDKYFIKVKDASGAKGIIPPGNPEKQVQAVLGPNYKRVIIQQTVTVEQRNISFKSILDGSRGRDNFATRYALFVSSNGKILDLGLTSSVGIIAHGGVQSIQMGYRQI